LSLLATNLLSENDIVFSFATVQLVGFTKKNYTVGEF